MYGRWERLLKKGNAPNRHRYRWTFLVRLDPLPLTLKRSVNSVLYIVSSGWRAWVSAEAERWAEERVDES